MRQLIWNRCHHFKGNQKINRNKHLMNVTVIYFYKKKWHIAIHLNYWKKKSFSNTDRSIISFLVQLIIYIFARLFNFCVCVFLKFWYIELSSTLNCKSIINVIIRINVSVWIVFVFVCLFAGVLRVTFRYQPIMSADETCVIIYSIYYV